MSCVLDVGRLMSTVRWIVWQILFRFFTLCCWCLMLLKLNNILLYGLVAFFAALVLYPFFIRLLKYYKVGKTIREDSVTGDKAVIFKDMHAHKAGTPNMGGAMLLIVMIVMVIFSLLLQHWWWTRHSLITREETYIILFAFFALWLLWLVDDYLNVKGHGTIKGLSAKGKLLGMFVIAAFISWWFYAKLGVDYITLSWGGTLQLWWLAPVLMFFLTVSIVNAINITDGLDGLAGWLLCIVLAVLAVATFMSQLYIATTVIGIVIAVLLAFMWFNINPAKIFMGDGGAFALAGLLSTLIYLLNMRLAIVLPFLFLFLLFWVEIASSALQMFWKKVFKRKLFTIAPFHHRCEHRGCKEWTIVMKAWLLQGLLALVVLIFLFYQFHVG